MSCYSVNRSTTWSQPLFAGRVGHLGSLGLILLLDARGLQKLLTVSSLLVLLDETAATAAERRRQVTETAALEVVLFAEVGSLHGNGDPVQTAAHGTTEEEALEEH